MLCLSAVTIRGLVLDWLDAEELDVRLSKWWVQKLLHGMHLSHKKPQVVAPQPCSARGQQASIVHQALLAHRQSRCQRRPRREHRRDFVPPPASASDRVGAAARSRPSCTASQKEATRAGHAGADRARGSTVLNSRLTSDLLASILLDIKNFALFVCLYRSLLVSVKFPQEADVTRDRRCKI